MDQVLTEAAPCEAADENPVPLTVEEEPQTKTPTCKEVSCDIVEQWHVIICLTSISLVYIKH